MVYELFLVYFGMFALFGLFDYFCNIWSISAFGLVFTVLYYICAVGLGRGRQFGLFEQSPGICAI